MSIRYIVYNYLNIPQTDNYEIDFYEYKDGYGYQNDNQYSNDKNDENIAQINTNLLNWKPIIIDNTSFELNFRPYGSEPYKKFKAIIKYNIANDKFQLEETEPFTFVNSSQENKPVTRVVSSGLIFSFLPGDLGIYDFYTSNGRAIDHSLINQEYQITVKLAEDDENNTLWKKVQPKVIWKYPRDSMIIDCRETNNQLFYKLNNTKFQSSLKILCEIEYYNEYRQKVKLSGSVSLQFGEFKSSGTNYSFNIHFDKDSEDSGINNRLTTVGGKRDRLKVSASFKKYTDTNDYIDLDIDPTKIKWEWVFPVRGEEWKSQLDGKENLKLEILKEKNTSFSNNNDYIANQKNKTSIYIKYSGTSLPNKNFGIIKATYEDYVLENGLTTNFTDYLIIPIGSPTYTSMVGPSELIYKSLTTEIERIPKIYYSLFPMDNEYFIQNSEYDKEYKIQWQLYNSTPAYWGAEGELELNTNNIASIEGATRYSLKYPDYAPSDPTILPQICITCSYDDNVIWTQSILVLQDTWSNQWINGWNGELTIDNENNVIAARSIVAGKKTGNNQFTGVKVGYAPKEDDEFYGSGIYGYKDGVNRFRLTDNGDFYVGTGENNQITFNSDGTLKIRAQDLDIESNYMKLNDKNGIFILKNSDKTYLDFNQGDLTIDTMTATNATVTGTINALSGKATSWQVYEPIKNNNGDITDISTTYQGEIGFVHVPYSNTDAFGLTSAPSKPLYLTAPGGQLIIQTTPNAESDIVNNSIILRPGGSIGFTISNDNKDYGLDFELEQGSAINSSGNTVETTYFTMKANSSNLSGLRFVGKDRIVFDINSSGVNNWDFSIVKSDNTYGLKDYLKKLGFIASDNTIPLPSEANFNKIQINDGGSLFLAKNTTLTVNGIITNQTAGGGIIKFNCPIGSVTGEYFDISGNPSAGDSSSNNRTKTGVRIYCGSGNNATDKKYREISISSTGLLYIDNN